MEQDFMTNLPSEITTNILSRLPLRAVAVSKCVCKPWLHLLESHDFVKSHFSGTQTVALLMPALGSTPCTVFELEDEAEVDLESHDLHYNPLTNFDFPFQVSSTEGTAANGFLLLHSHPRTLYVCNPLTRDYIKLCNPVESLSAYGFGVSKISGQYKVVCIDHARYDGHRAYVYTLGTGSRRWVKASDTIGYICYLDEHIGKFVSGNLHWGASTTSDTELICCFDVQTECFSIISAPPVYGIVVWYLSVLRDCLCVCYTTKQDEKLVIWLMKEYGVEKSWTMEYVISTDPYFVGDGYLSFHYPIKVFKDGDILMSWDDEPLYYSNKTKTIQEVGLSDAGAAMMILTPSLFSLKSFGNENVISF